ncbi:Intradiol ring-cleavage dioxygenase [Elsinoe ampelina]|uniref:Intradiol ring-cleavage dioxygenase n=1 Tax=Elsinoe ampelina TaxID=302913 RepID=A0A6A6G261_9PEZI|nr:Intradiol ring-cleavage dioxygenase [Elsinoe ampelina]
MAVNGSKVTNPIPVAPIEQTSNGTSKFDPDFTRNVINATGPKASPRVRKVVGGLIQHLHDWLRENEVTVEEWMAGVDLINQAGRMSDEKRNEGQLMCDVLGIESLVDEITYKVATDAPDLPTATAILGPFWRKDAPKRAMGDSIIIGGIEKGDYTLMSGEITDFVTGKPIEGAEVDVWHTAPNGLYEQQDPDQPDMNLRGRFTTGADGKYSFYCLRPTSYPIPFDGPSGTLLKLLDRHPMRPAHIHFIVSAPGYKPLVTQIFDRRDEYITNDSVFAVKDSLVVDFVPFKGDPKADFKLDYDFRLASYESGGQNGAEPTPTSSA